MVHLSLAAPHGGTRAFPHAGYLALTPLKIEGSVRTRIDHHDKKPLRAYDIQVALRCYEQRVGRSGVAHSRILVDHTVTLWSKPPEQQWADIGDGDWPFKIVLPPRLAGPSSATFHDYRVFWRVEAVINHVPIAGIGHKMVKTCDITLLRYDAGAPLPPNQQGWCQVGRPKSGLPSLRYVVRPPTSPLGPQDLVPVSFKLSPTDPSAVIASISCTIERRFAFNAGSFPSSGLDDDDDGGEEAMSSTAHLLRRTPPPPSPKSNGLKVTTTVIASAENTEISRDERGFFRKTVTLQIPTPKSASHWAIGETMRTELVTLRFFLRTKVTLAYPSTGALETLDLEDQELLLIAANESERRLAKLKYHEAVARARSRDGNGNKRLPSPPPSPPLDEPSSSRARMTLDEPTPSTSSSSSKPKTSRRPHTSAGPRDAARGTRRSLMASSGSSNDSHASGARSALRVRSSRGVLSAASAPVSASNSSSGHGHGDIQPLPAVLYPCYTPIPPTPSSPLPGQRATPLPSPGLTGLPTPVSPDFVQAWEEELERIAVQSQRRSEQMKGFVASGRVRMTNAT